MLKQSRKLRAAAAVLCWCAAVLFGMARAAETEWLTNRFGFAGKEIFPIDHQIGHLRSADLDSDGLEDLVVVNNGRSKINLLYNQTGKTNLEEALERSVKRQINELPPDARFRIDAISSEKRISSLVVTDVSGDRRPDLVYYGEPKELVVQYNEGAKNWSPPKRWPIEDGLLNPNALVSGDLNSDDRTDLVLLAESHLYLLAQDEQNALAEPVKIPYSGTVQAVQVLDIQGDGRDDLLLVNWDNPNPFRFRLQDTAGELGPEIHFPLPAIRSYWADDLDHDRQTEVITIAQRSGRAEISNFARRPAETLSGEWRRGQFEVLPLTRTSKARRGMAWADLNGDSLTDLIVAEPESGQLSLHLQASGGTLAAPKMFPALTGISDLSVADWDRDGVPEVFVLRLDERQIGVTRFDKNGRLAFPEPVGIRGRPLAMAVGSLQPDQNPVLVAITELDGKRQLQTVTASGEIWRKDLNEKFKSAPRSMAIHDLDQDGKRDIAVLIPYENMKVLLQTEANDFVEHDVTPPGGAADQPWFTSIDVDGDHKEELILAQKNFLRAVVLQHDKTATDAAWSFAVKEQINGVASNSRIVGAAALRNGTNEVSSIFMLDAERKSLTLSERNQAGVWQVVRNVSLPVSDYTSIEGIGLGQAEPNSVGMLGNSGVAWMRLHGEVWELAALDSYESPIRNAYLHDVVSGDLNHDRRKDLVFLETSKHYLDVVLFEPPHRLVPANRWQVFEQRTFRSRRTESAEPREALVTDLNNDGKNDLAVIVHDRIIVYPQE